MEEKKQRHVDLLGPVLLIAVGVILLLNVLGILEWSVWWTIIQLWPIFLIAFGLELLIGRRSVWGSFLVVVLVICIAAGALWLSQAGVVGELATSSNEISQPLEGATEAMVVIEPGVRILHIEALPEAANLVEGRLQLAGDEEVVQEFTRAGERATLQLRTTRHDWGPYIGGFGGQRSWDLGMSPAPRLELETDIGLGEARLDLTGLSVDDLQTNMGVGLTRVTLPAQGSFRGDVNGAVGITTIIIPEGLEARIQVDSGLVVRVIPDGYRRQGDVYTSPGYGTGDDQVDLAVSQAIGLLEVWTRD
jgi:hypothetical protein